MAPYLAFFGVLSLGVAWSMPLTIWSAFLGWCGAFGLVYYAYDFKWPYLNAYVAGIIAHINAFHWLFYTIRDFGGFDNFPAFMVFSLFIAVSSLQFPFYVLLLRRSPFRNHPLAAPTAWIGAEFLSLRIFPWYLGHTQINFSEFVQVADIAGAATVSFLMVWICASLADLAKRGSISRALPAIVIGCAACIYGVFRLDTMRTTQAPEIEVALVQANVSVEEKHNIKMFRTNVERYKEMTRGILKPDLLVVWPESVITEWVYAGLKNASEDPKGRVPFFEDTSLLIGSLTFESEKRFFNSALGIAPGGNMTGIYHKQILMPFGEYTPFGDIFPFMRDLNATAADFTAGDGIKVFNIPVGGAKVRAAPLICYEDLLPSLGREAEKQGANLLVNITNDAWFGDSVAPLQHHLIAAFRAIETRRYLLRATNTGLTAVVNHLGETTKTIPGFSDGILSERVRLLEVSTVFSRYLGEIPWWILSFLSLVCLVLPRSLLGKQ